LVCSIGPFILKEVLMNATLDQPRVKVGRLGGVGTDVPFRPGMTAGDALAAAGITLNAGESISLAGRRGDLRTPIQPCTTVVPAPLISNG
jgi:hypothetical protein